MKGLCLPQSEYWPLLALMCHRVIRWEPDYFTVPVVCEGDELLIPWPNGCDYRGLCVEAGKLHAILKPELCSPPA